MSAELAEDIKVLNKVGGLTQNVNNFDITNMFVLTKDSANTNDIFGDGSCVATYKFESNLNDLSALHNGTSPIDISYTTSGKYGSAAVFSNASQSRFTAFDFITNRNVFSISYWIYPISSGDYTLLSTSSLTFTGSFLLSYNNVQFWDGSGKIIGPWTATLNTWTHVALSFDAPNGRIKVYLNGVLYGTMNTTINQQITRSCTGYIGCRDTPSYWYDGRLDQFRIFNKVISDAEVTKLYNEVTVTQPPVSIYISEKN